MAKKYHQDWESHFAILINELVKKRVQDLELKQTLLKASETYHLMLLSKRIRTLQNSETMTCNKPWFS